MTPDLLFCKTTCVCACVCIAVGLLAPAGCVERAPFGGISWPVDQFPMGRNRDPAAWVI